MLHAFSDVDRVLAIIIAEFELLKVAQSDEWADAGEEEDQPEFVT